MLVAMVAGTDARTTQLAEYAERADGLSLRVRRAAITLDERQDGEPVTRALLLVDDPQGDTWNVEAVRELRGALGRKATELDLPPVSLTLVPASEAKFVEPFTR
jgi:hypothetical protein